MANGRATEQQIGIAEGARDEKGDRPLFSFVDRQAASRTSLEDLAEERWV